MLAAAFASKPEHAPVPPRGAAAMPAAADTLANCAREGTLRTLAAKEHIFCEGDAATHIYRVEAGHVCIYKTLVDGRRHVIDFAYPGDWIGLGAIGRHTNNALASTATRLQAVPVARLKEVASRNASLGLMLYEAVSRELLAARELLFTVSHRSATERLASFLLALSRRNASRGEAADTIVLPMTRADIADFLGLTIETVSRTFTKLRLLGAIDIEQSILVVIRDAQALADLADGETDGSV